MRGLRPRRRRVATPPESVRSVRVSDSFRGEPTMEQTFVPLKNYSHKVGINHWHLVWATKYRYKMFGKFKQRSLCEAALRKTAKRHGIRVHNVNVQPDHVHLLATLPHRMTESEAFRLLKGGSAYLFFKNHPRSRLRLPRGHLWSPGGCAVSVGYTDFNTTSNYIDHQDEY